MLSLAEYATVLAALRHWQRTVIVPAPDLESVRSAHPNYFEAHAPLDAAAIDELCERLNLDEPPKTYVVVADRPGDSIETRFYEAYAMQADAQTVLDAIRSEQPAWRAAVVELEVHG
ncbi:MAG: hypothetical protein HS116_05790 [Planctomycetes bacterium]|nr:hypothetical protein [Planctomycetota bacterium]